MGQKLRQFIQEASPTLLKTLQLYLIRAGLTDDPHDLWHEVVMEALQHEDRFRADGQPRAWLLGIAANLIKRRQAEQWQRHQREPLIRDLHEDASHLSDDELFDRVAGAYQHEDGVIQALLAQLAPPDQEIIQLAILHEMNGDEIAVVLGIRPGAARVRLHRALQRLRHSQEITPHEEL